MLKLTQKLCAGALVILISLPVFAQRHAINFASGDSSHGRNTHFAKRDINFGFLSPINQHLSFGYEQALSYMSTISAQVGIIGPGINDQMSGYGPTIPGPKGVFLSCGAKLFVNPDFLMDGMYRYNSMQGFYFMPEVIAGYFYEYDYSYYNNYPNPSNTLITNTVNNYAVMLNVGKQWVLENIITINIHAGIGYGGYKDTQSPTPQQLGYPNGGYYNEYPINNFYNYISSNTGSNVSLAFSGGIDIGVLLK